MKIKIYTKSSDLVFKNKQLYAFNSLKLINQLTLHVNKISIQLTNLYNSLDTSLYTL